MSFINECYTATCKHVDHSAMAAFENQYGPVALFVRIVFQFLPGLSLPFKLFRSRLLNLRLAFLACIQAIICSLLSSLQARSRIPERVSDSELAKKGNTSAHVSLVRMGIVFLSVLLRTYIRAPSPQHYVSGDKKYVVVQCFLNYLGL